MRRLRQATAAWLVALALTATVLSSCSSPAGDDKVCNDADRAVVSDIMATARTNFQTGGTITNRFEFIEAATAPIPESERQYGAAELMVLLVAVYLEGDDPESGLTGAQGPVYVVLDDDGQPLGPLGTPSQPFFDLQPPADPGWTAWADGLERTSFASGLFGCVNPN